MGGWDQLPPPRIRRCPVGSVSVQAWRPRRGGEQERESSQEHVLPFYRGICACTEHVHIRAVQAMRAARLGKSALARPGAAVCTSALLQVVVAVFSRGQEETTMAMSRQNQFVVVFYTTLWLDIAAFVVVWEVVV